MDATAEEVLEAVEGYKNILLTGPHYKMFLDICRKNDNITEDPFAGLSRIEFLIEICEKMYNNGNTDTDAQGPVYIRKSDAEEALSREK